jgi:general secretion pathway protein A
MRRIVMGLISIGMVALSFVWTPSATAGDEAETAELLITLLKSGRAIVSENQGLINDASKGHKGFTDDFFAQQAAEKFKAKTKIDLNRAGNLPQGPMLMALLDSEKEVVAEAQMVINKQGIGFKGFLPAVFARKSGERFYKKTGVRLKLTGLDYRNPGNKPDDFEQEVLRMFADPRHPKGQQYVKTTMVAGKPVLRVMDPEYAGATCLSCHGSPKGERDITGMKKEGWKEGDLAGAISLTLPIK